MRRPPSLFAFSSMLILLSISVGPVLAAASDPAEAIPTLLSTELPKDIEVTKVPTSAANESLSPQALELAKLTGILPIYKRLRAEQQKAKTLNRAFFRLPTSSSSSKEDFAEQSNREQLLEALFIKQRIIYIRTQIAQSLQTANLELNSVLGRLNSGMARLADTKAIIADERARILRRNSFINLISGGITKIGGYSSALTPASLIPTNVLEVFDGGVQTSLSMLTIREQRNESKLYKSKPEILTSFINSQNHALREYPDSIWTYLNQRDLNHKDNQTRRDILIEYWLSTGRLSGASTSKKSAANNTGYARTHISKMDDIDDSVAMMSDLKSAVSEMEISLMELSEVIKDSYKNDPEF